MNIENKEMQELYNSLTPEQQKAAKELKKAFISSFAKTDWSAAAEEKLRLEIEAAERNEWIVDTKISADGRSVEVSAVVKGTHGENMGLARRKQIRRSFNLKNLWPSYARS